MSAAVKVRCPICSVPVTAWDEMDGFIVRAIHCRPYEVDRVMLPGFGGGVALAVETIAQWARDRHDPFGP